MVRESLAHSRLDFIRDWDARAQRASYHVSQLSKQCGVTEHHLRRFVVARFGKSPGEWLAEKRLARGACKLQEHALVKEAAAEAGLTPANFSRKFSHRYGVAPRDYRSGPGA